MTITMAKHRRAACALAPLVLLLTPSAQATWKFSPLLNVREIYSDNLDLRPRGQEEGGFRSEIAPGFRLSNQGRRFNLDAVYQYRYYTNVSEFDQRGERIDRGQSELGATMKATLVENLFYFDAVANISQQPVSAFDALPSETALGSNRSEVRSYRATPSLRHSFGNTATVDVGYTYDVVETGTRAVGSSQGDTIAFSLASGSRFTSVGWDVQASQQQVSYDFAPDVTSKNASVGLSYALSRTFKLTSRVGYDDYDYAALGGSTGGRSWSAGFQWAPNARTRVDATVGKRYYGSSYYLNASHRTRRMVFDLRYNDAVTSTRDEFVLPSAVSTADMLDRLFAATIFDPVARKRAVENYIRASGLPPSLANNINYFSNRYFLQRELQASAGLRGTRSNLLLSAFAVRRIALSNVDTDSALLGPNSSSLNDSNRQVGANILWNLRLNSSNEINTIAQVTRVRSDATGIEATHKSASVSLQHRFDRRFTGILELRRQAGPNGLTGPGYVENAVSASVNMLF